MNLLPLPAAIENLEAAIKDYQRLLAAFKFDPTRRRFAALAQGYSRVATAQWEVAQHGERIA